MRSAKVTLLLSCLAVAASARPALADEPPTIDPAAQAPGEQVLALPAMPRRLKLDLPLSVSEEPWATPRANVASLAPLAPLHLAPRLWGSSGASRPLLSTGAVLMGLGIMTLFGSGVAGIVAAVEASQLGEECPNKVCYEDTRGGRSLARARDAALASDWLLGIGAPVTASGVVLMLYSAVVDRYGRVVSPSPVFSASPTGGSLMFKF